MNATYQSDRSTHTLYPSSQPFLWLPGFSGEEHPYCTYNNEPAECNGSDPEAPPSRDEKGARYAPPFPVSTETQVSWHTDVTPPYPYHPIPVAHTLSDRELDELGRNVIHLLEEASDTVPDLRQALRNCYKSHIVVALSRMGLLPEGRSDSPTRRHTGTAC